MTPVTTETVDPAADQAATEAPTARAADPQVRVGGDVAQRMLASARWRQ